MDLGLTGLRAIVTGGSAGIGAAIVRVLATEGCNVSFCGRRQERIDDVLRSVDKLPGAVSGCALDIANTTSYLAWLESLGEIDILVANASAISTDWRTSIDTDIQGTVSTTEATLPYLYRSNSAAITYVGSKIASLPAPDAAAYGAAKAAMAHYMKSLAWRVLPGIRVNTVSPGDTWFPGCIWQRMQTAEPHRFDAVLARNPMRRLATVEEVARVVAFVSSPAASFVAGVNWYVDGGSVGHVQF